jgi:hypothetical protein
LLRLLRLANINQRMKELEAEDEKRRGVVLSRVFEFFTPKARRR